MRMTRIEVQSRLFFSGNNKELPKRFKKYIDEKLAHLSHAERKILKPVLIRYAGIFHYDEDNDFKSTNVVVHKIETGDATPIKKAPYKTPFALRQEMNRQVQKMLNKRVISPSYSPWSSPVVLVPNKSENGVPKYRFCVDFRALNAVTKYDSYPLPRFEETTSTLSGSKYFSVLDCYSGFWQINIHEPHREKTAFSLPSLGHYQFNRLPYGLSNSPASFQRLMDLVLKNMTGAECWVFIDDVIVYSDTAEEHATRLSDVLERFRRANLQLQLEECVFAKDKFTYLGLELSYRGTEVSPDKGKAVQNFPAPQSVKDIRSFLDVASFYRRLVPHFVDIAKALTQLTKKDKMWDWNQECQESFDKLKSKLSNNPVLAFPDFNVPFILTTDASTVGLGAILSQVQEGIERPISFASRQLNKAQRAYSASELETLAVV